MSIRVCLVNTQAYRHSCRMATGCYLPRTTVCLGPNMTRPPAEICRLIETSLRHLHISAYGHAIESSVKSFYSHRTMKCFSHCFMRFSPACLCGYSFAKVLSALPNAKPETANLPQTELSVFAVPSFALLPANTLETQKISLCASRKA